MAGPLKLITLCTLLGVALSATLGRAVEDGPKVKGENQFLKLHNEVVAQVNYEKISKRDVESRMELIMMKLHAYESRKRAAGEWDENAQAQWDELYFPPFRDELRNIIKDRLMIQEFKDRKMEFDKSEYEKQAVDTIARMRADGMIGSQPGQFSEAQVKQDVKDRMMIEDVRGSFLNIFVMPNNRDITDYYEKHKSEFPRKPGDKIRRIRILRFQADNLGREKVVEGAAQRAEELRRQASPETFADLARDNSQDDAEVVKRGGMIGVKDGEEFIETGSLSGPMATALRGLQVGGISEIFQLDEKSWGFVYYEEHRDAGIRPIEGKLFEEIKKKLTNEARQRLENEWLFRALKRSLVLDAWQAPIPVKFFFPNGDIPDESILNTKPNKTAKEGSKEPPPPAKDPKATPKNKKTEKAEKPTEKSNAQANGQ